MSTDTKQAWTPEPWKARLEDEPYECEVAGKYWEILGVGVLFVGDKALDKANTLRAIACVNAMKGIPDPAAHVKAVTKLQLATAELRNSAKWPWADGSPTPIINRVDDALAAFPNMKWIPA